MTNITLHRTFVLRFLAVLVSSLALLSLTASAAVADNRLDKGNRLNNQAVAGNRLDDQLLKDPVVREQAAALVNRFILAAPALADRASFRESGIVSKKRGTRLALVFAE